jgi:hypothetical protein
MAASVIASSLSMTAVRRSARCRGPLDHQPDRQAQTLATVAEALAARGETRQARHVASVACAVGRWTMALVPVLSRVHLFKRCDLMLIRD